MKLTPLENWIVEKSCIGERNREALEEYQLCRIRETLIYAKKNSRFYGNQLKDIRPDEIRSMEDVQTIPFAFPQDIQDDPFSFLCVPQSEITRIVSLCSTGTSGKEKRIFFSEEDLNQTIDFFLFGMSCLIDKTDKVMVMLPGNSYGSIGDLLKKALEKAQIECFVHGVLTDAEAAANEIVNNNISCIVGIPTQVLELSRTKSEIFKIRIKSVLLSTDFIPEVLIRELTEQCGCRVFTHYGMTEMGYGGGVECEALSGYHLREADLYFEIVDPQTGQSVPDGEYGEVVFTTLARKAMPLIRYRTGDIASFSPSHCACGTILKTMKHVKGRTDNRISLSENEYLYLWELDEAIFAFREVSNYKAGTVTGNCLGLEVMMENIEVFQSCGTEIAASIQRLADEKFGHKIKLRLSLSPRNEAQEIINSMTKRTFRA